MSQKISSLSRILIAIVCIALAAQITFDIGEIPITGQTLAILIWAFFLKEWQALSTLTLYLILGFCGAPIFADGGHGIEKLIGGSGGFLFGFLVAAIIVSYLQNHYNFTSLLTIVGCTLLGTLIILIFGTGRLIILHGFENGINYGLIPFWKGAILKILLGSLVVWIIKKITNRQALPAQ